jgi:lipopolysaccharide exporter
LSLFRSFFKRRPRSLFENTLWGIYGELFSRIVKFVQLILIANHLGVDGMGLFNYSLAAAGIMSVFYDFGILVVATKNNTQSRTHSDLAPYLLFKCATSLIGYVIFLGLLYLEVLKTDNAYVISILVASIIISDIANLILASYRVKQDFQQEAKFRSWVIIAQFLGSGIVLFLNGGLREVAISLLLINIISLYPMVRLIISHSNNHLTNFTARLRALFVECLPFAGIVMVGALYTNVDVLLLGHFLGMKEVGVYAVAMKFVLGLIIVPISYVQNAQIPSLVAHDEYNSTDISGLYKEWMVGYKTTTLIGYLICLTFVVLAEYIIKFTFGSKFIDSVAMLESLTIVGISYYLYTPLITLFIITKKAKFSFYGQLFCCVVNIVLLWWWIPIYGITGAVAAAIISHLLIFLILFVITQRLLPLLFPIDVSVGIFFRLVLFLAIIYLMRYADVQPFMREGLFKLFLSLLFIFIVGKDVKALCLELWVVLNRLRKT